MAHYQAAVIIPSRGGAGVLHYPLDALSAQTERDFQVIVVLDGDIDQSEKVVDDYIARRTLNLTKIVFPENLGRVAALNAGHNAADADILIRCDDDLEPGPDYVANHLRLHRDYDGVIGTLNNIFPKTAYSQVYGTYRDAKFKEAALRTPNPSVGTIGMETRPSLQSNTELSAASIPPIVFTAGKTSIWVR